MKYQAALDLSGPAAALAAVDAAGRTVLSVSRPMRGREAAELSEGVVKSLAGAGVSPDEVASWTVGSGPGSFTGLRLAAALISGWSYERPEVRVRCVPTAVALGRRLPRVEGERWTLLFDGRNRELLTFELEMRDGEVQPVGEPGVMSGADAPAALAGRRLAAPVTDREAIARWLPGVDVSLVELRAEELIAAREPEFDGDLTRLVYIRPAVHPKEV